MMQSDISVSIASVFLTHVSSALAKSLIMGKEKKKKKEKDSRAEIYKYYQYFS